MSDQNTFENPVLLRTSPGAVVPNSLPSEALFILNLGPFLTDETQSLAGANESRRAKQLLVLAEKIEEIASILEDVRNEQIVGTDPDPDDEEMLNEVWSYLNGVLNEHFVEMSQIVNSLVASINEVS